MSAIIVPASDKSRITQAVGCMRANSSSAGMVFTDRNSKPRSRPVPTMRLVKIRSSQSRSPMGIFGFALNTRRARRLALRLGNHHSPLTTHSNGLRAAFAGADADAIFQRQNEDFAVADA